MKTLDTFLLESPDAMAVEKPICGEHEATGIKCTEYDNNDYHYN